MHIPHPFDLPERSEEEQRAFYEAVLARAVEAEAQAGTVERFYELAGVRIRIVFAGPTLETLLHPAIAHLETERPGAIGATFHVWDSLTTGVPMVPAPCEMGCFTDRGDVWGMGSERFRFAFHWSDYSVNVADMAASTFVYWVKEPQALPYWSKSSPMRTLFHWLMEAQGCQLLHAAAVGDENGAVLITGKGGVGKSTSALAALNDGMLYIGDDYLVVRLDPEPEVISLYSTAKLHAGHAANFPRFRASIANSETMFDEKAVLNLYPEYSEQIVRVLPLKAVMLPNIVPAVETVFGPASPEALQRAAAFTTMSQLPHAGRRTHDFITRMIGAVPGVEIRLGSDFAGIPRAIRRFLADPEAETIPVAGPADATRSPLVSVIVPVHNGAHFLKAAVDSILAQDYPAIEIIVVDDGSTDAIEAAVAALPVDVRFFRQPAKGGPAAARNRGIKDAYGEFVAFLDVDDLWPAATLRTLLEALDRDPDAMVARGFGQLFREEENGEMRYLGNPEESYPFYIGAGLYRREVFHRVGLFDPTLTFGEDTDWYTAAAQAQARIVKLPIVTLYVRRHDGNMTRGKSMPELNQFRVFQKMLQRRREQAGAVGIESWQA